MKPMPENDVYRSTVVKGSVTTTHPHSKLGMVSCVCSVLAWLLLVMLALKPDWAGRMGCWHLFLCWPCWARSWA